VQQGLLTRSRGPSAGTDISHNSGYHRLIIERMGPVLLEFVVINIARNQELVQAARAELAAILERDLQKTTDNRTIELEAVRFMRLSRAAAVW
jgi:hypothetical protein